MGESKPNLFLPAALGTLRRQGLEGELVLVQSEGIRRIFFSKGDLCYTRSEVPGEYFGDFLTSEDLLTQQQVQALLDGEEAGRLGELAVQQGWLDPARLDALLLDFLEQLLTRMLERPTHRILWNPGPLTHALPTDLQFPMDHRLVIWRAYQGIHETQPLREQFEAERSWRWRGQEDLLMTLADLPLTTQAAFALSQMAGLELDFEGFASLTGMEAGEAAKILGALWSLGDLPLSQGQEPDFIGRTGSVKTKPPGSSTPEYVSGFHRAAPTPHTAPPPQTPPSLPTRLELNVQLPTRRGTESDPPRATTFQKATPTSPPTHELPDSKTSSGQGTPSWKHGTSPNSPTLQMTIAQVKAMLAARDKSQSEVQSKIESAAEFQPPPTLETSPPELDPQLVAKLIRKAKSLELQAKPGDAIKALERATQIDPECYEGWLMLGKHRMVNLAWSTRALEALQKASRIKPDAAEPWALMGDLYHRKNFRANALGCFKKALELDPSVEVPADLDMNEKPKESPKLLGKIGSGLKNLLSRDED